MLVDTIHKEVGNVVKGHGVRSDQHPVNNWFHWIPACAGMTKILRRTLVQSFLNKKSEFLS